MSRVDSFADANAFFLMAAAATHARGRGFDAWSRFALEVDGANIVAPHLYVCPRRARLGSELGACTIAGPLVVAVFAWRSALHRTFLEEEIVPRVRRICPHLLLADTNARTFRESGTRESRPLSELPEVLDGLTSPGTFEPLELDSYESFFRGDLDELTEDAAAIERSPIRLWEILFSRGFSGRYELLGNEVPVLAELGTELAANRSLMQCVQDAEAWCRCSATDECGWIRAGRFRMRQLGTILEVRVSLSAADVRVAFAPRQRQPGWDQLPSVPGVLLAGGDNGKTELVNGYTWSGVICRDEAELERLAPALRDEISRWTGARVVVTSSPGIPKETDGRWVISLRPDTRDPFLTVFVPMRRDHGLPFRVVG